MTGQSVVAGRRLFIQGGRKLSGRVVAPPDKSITHRALILAALGTGRCRIAPLSNGADNRSTIAALKQLGVPIEVDEAAGIAWVEGVGGPQNLSAPSAPLDCGNSGTTMRLLAGVAAASSSAITLTGDASLCARPMSRLSPLQTMGARLTGVERDGRIYPPITVDGAGPLAGMVHRLPIASAQVKTAIMLAGLWADGPTTVHEPGRSRDHTERMLTALGVSVQTLDDEGLQVDPVHEPWRADAIDVAPDLSSAAFLLGAALVTDGDLEVETAVNPTRAGFLDALRALGARIEQTPLPPCGGEPMARVCVSKGEMAGATIEGSLTLRAIDEIPLIAGLAAFVPGRTEIRDAGELRVKESDRIAATAGLLRAFGADVTERADGLIIEGAPDRLAAARVEAGHDHRIGLTAAVMGLGLPGCTEVANAEIIDVSYPGFAAQLVALGGEVEESSGREVPD